MVFKMRDDSWTTLEHKTPESNKSDPRLGWPLCSWPIREIIRRVRPYRRRGSKLVIKEEGQWRLSDVIPAMMVSPTLRT
jgi:hypothetical protein